VAQRLRWHGVHAIAAACPVLRVCVAADLVPLEPHCVVLYILQAIRGIIIASIEHKVLGVRPRACSHANWNKGNVNAKKLLSYK